MAAVGSDAHASAEALSELCGIYWSPVYSVVRRQVRSVDDARDLTQEFFARVIEKGTFASADKDRGRFRSFLCASVRNFLSNERDRQFANKRGGRTPHLSIDWEQAEHHFHNEPSTDVTPDTLFDRQWALVLLERVMARLSNEYGEQGKRAQFDALKPYLMGEGPATGYRDAAAALGTSEGALKVAVHRLRKRFRDTLVDEITDTVSSADEVDAELQHLLASLQR